MEHVYVRLRQRPQAPWPLMLELGRASQLAKFLKISPFSAWWPRSVYVVLVDIHPRRYFGVRKLSYLWALRSRGSRFLLHGKSTKITESQYIPFPGVQYLLSVISICTCGGLRTWLSWARESQIPLRIELSTVQSIPNWVLKLLPNCLPCRDQSSRLRITHHVHRLGLGEAYFMILRRLVLLHQLEEVRLLLTALEEVVLLLLAWVANFHVMQRFDRLGFIHEWFSMITRGTLSHIDRYRELLLLFFSLDSGI